jgi:hypothetical protein
MVLQGTFYWLHIPGTGRTNESARRIAMRKADAIELLDSRTFIMTRRFGGELFRTYERGDREDIECETLEAEIQGMTLTFHATGRHKSDPKGKPWSHEYSYVGHFVVHWEDA